MVEVETMVAARVMEFTQELGIDSTIIEGDSELVINTLKDVSPSHTSFGLLIQDTKVFAKSFHCLSFSHVCCEGNSVTHNLARYATHVTGFLV